MFTNILFMMVIYIRTEESTCSDWIDRDKVRYNSKFKGPRVESIDLQILSMNLQIFTN